MAKSMFLSSLEIDEINSSIFFLTKGSPPVSLILFIPSLINILVNLTISSKDKT